MPEKVETNGRPMPETPPAKVEETAHKIIREAGVNMEDTFRTYNELVATTTKYYFDMLGNVIRDTMELNAHAQHAIEDTMTIYRRFYTEEFKSWEAYWQDISKMVPRPR